MTERKHLRPRAALRQDLATAGVSVMRLELAEGRVLGEHDHDVIELAWVARGTLRHRIGVEELSGTAGSLLILPSARSHTYAVASGGAELWNLLIDPARLAAVLLPAPLGRHLPILLPAAGGPVALVEGVALGPALAGLAAELALPAPGRLAALGLHLRLILLAAARAVQAGRVHLLAAGDARIAELMRRVEAEPERAWDLATLARLAGLQPAGLVRAFRRHAGTTPLAWVRATRRRAAWALISEGHGVAAAARAVGYGGAGALAKACRRCGGPAPGAWRRDRSAYGSDTWHDP